MIRWLEVSVPCACKGAVSVLTACPQPADDDRIWVAAGDAWRCEEGHAGWVSVSADQTAWLGEPEREAVTAEQLEDAAPDGPSLFRGALVARAP